MKNKLILHIPYSSDHITNRSEYLIDNEKSNKYIETKNLIKEYLKTIKTAYNKVSSV